MVKSAQDGAGDNGTVVLDWPIIRRILVQSEMSSCPFRKLYPTILVVQAAKEIACDYASAALHGPVVRGIFP